MNIDLIPRLSSDYALHRDATQGADVFLFNVQTGAVFKLNATSYDFLSLCCGSRSIGQIFEKLATEYVVEKDVLVADFEPLVAKWLEMKVLV